ncbi:MAG: hypothetical protein QXU57_01975 [Fervidicoccaceae archaeon]
MTVLSITHTDLDGVASSAVLLRAWNVNDYTVAFTEPDSLHLTLRSFRRRMQEVELIAITDLGPNPAIFEDALEILSSARKRGKRVVWIDHHVWRDEWKNAALHSNIELKLNEDLCATGIAAEEAKGDSYIADLAKITCSADQWRFDEPLSPFLVRYVGFSRDPSWLTKVHRAFLSSESIDSLMKLAIPRAIEIHELELRNIKSFIEKVFLLESGKLKIAIGIKKEPEISSSLLGQFMLARFNADIAVIVNERGKLEFRSNRCNVRNIAYELGGGGHPKASGSPIPTYAKFAMKLMPSKVGISLVARIVRNAVDRVGCVSVQ